MPSPLGLTFKTSDSGIPSFFGANKSYKVVSSKAVSSLFTGGGQFSPFPSSFNAETGSVTSMRNAFDIHKDDIYDTSVTGIIDYCKKYEGMKLDYADFAYLKNLGVYPNNRLMIARRFSSGVSNDLTSIKTQPMATLIGWVKDGEDFMSVSFNENWVAAEADFTDVLNDIGKDSKASSDQGTGLGSLAARAFDAIPLPGFMEGIQYEVMKKMGLSDAGIGNSPLGNPNLIREAKRRSTVSKGEAGSGLAASISVKMIVEYEQKFINGVDPTLVYMDILQNALNFGTSDAAFQFNSAFGTGTNEIIKNLISGDLAAIGKAIGEFVQSMLDAIANVGKQLIDALIDPPSGEISKEDIYNFVKKAFASTLGHVVSKYKVRIQGIANALTGSPSTPWHITIGNPKKPLFSSGDMLCGAVTLTVGKNLAFNDLPSYIKLEFELTNARPLGAQEIFNRFNTGKGRSYVRFNKSFVESGDIDFKDPVESKTVTKSGTQSITTYKNEVSPTVVPTAPDDYLIDKTSFANGTDWILGSNPASNTPPVKTGDDTSPQISNTPETSPSKSSINNPATPTANISAGVTTPTPTIGSSPLSSQEISNGSDSLLESRKRNILEELKATNPSDPKYNGLDTEYRAIRAEQSNREDDEALGIKRK